MKSGLYYKLAADGIKKNKKLYIPYILSSTGMIMMFYILSFLSSSPEISRYKGGGSITQILGLGCYVIAIFAGIFLFYTNSFLMKKRKKEFGLYNILGLAKKNISKIIIIENVIIYVISLAGGLFLGAVFSKWAELTVIRIMHGEAENTFKFTAPPFIKATVLFAVIFVVLILRSLKSVKISTPAELLKSVSTGEKTPKANLLTGVIGFLILGGAYWFSVTVKSPISAFLGFFFAVVAVIIATYLIFISGSVMICGILKKNKKYYYKTKHFISVSQMSFRMKRSGAGLASICILSTMVLVMMAATSSLYFGTEDSLNNRYPYEIETVVTYNSEESLLNSKEKIGNEVLSYTEKNGINITDSIDISYSVVTGLITDEYIELDPQKAENSINYGNLCSFCFFTLDDYNRITGKNLTLNGNEVYTYCYRGDIDKENTINFGNKLKLTKKGNIEKFFIPGGAAVNIADCCLVIVKGFDVLSPLDTLADFNGDKLFTYNHQFAFNSDCSEETKINCIEELGDIILKITAKNENVLSVRTDSLAANKKDFYGTFGGMFFIGIILSVIFMFATVMIIYYKQISEGYEDVQRYEIMQKVGMTKKEIKKSINSQMLTVFFAPLALSVCHLAASFPATRKILLMFNLNNTATILITTGITVIVFAIFYTIVYKVTSNEYYKIVSKSNN